MKYLDYANKTSCNQQEQTIVTLDISGSMDCEDYNPTRLGGAILAAKRLIEVKAEKYLHDEIGIAGFSCDARVVCPVLPLTKGTSQLTRSLNNLSTEGSTNFNAGLKLAEKMLFGIKNSNAADNLVADFLKNFLFETVTIPAQTSKSGQKIKRIIMLSDGMNTGSSPVNTATRLKSSGVIIQTVGIAGDRHSVDEELLKKIATKDKSGNPMYCFISDTESLIKKYDSMAYHIKPA